MAHITSHRRATVEVPCNVPEMHGLRTNRAVPELVEARSLLAPGGGVDSSTGAVPWLAEERTEVAEDAGAGAERHCDRI